MPQSSTASAAVDRDDGRGTESLSQLRIKICSVRLSSSSKLVDVCVIMEVDNKYTYRTEVVRKKGKSNTRTAPTASHPVVTINESFDVLVSSNSKIRLRILAPSLLFGNHDIGHVQFNIKSIINDYSSTEHEPDGATPVSHTVQFPFEPPIASSILFRPNNTNPGCVELIFFGSILKQEPRIHEPRSEQNAELVSDSLIAEVRLLFVSRAYSIHPPRHRIQPWKIRQHQRMTSISD